MKSMDILGGKKQKPVELAIKIRNPTVKRFTGFLIKSNCVYLLRVFRDLDF